MNKYIEISYRGLLSRNKPNTSILLSTFKSIDKKNGIIEYKTISKDSNLEYIQILQFDSFSTIFEKNPTLQTLRQIFMKNNIKVKCDCLDFPYRRSYLLTKLKAIYGTPENRPPLKMNKKMNNPLCKHLDFVLRKKLMVDSILIYNELKK